MLRPVFSKFHVPSLKANYLLLSKLMAYKVSQFCHVTLCCIRKPKPVIYLVKNRF